MSHMINEFSPELIELCNRGDDRYFYYYGYVDDKNWGLEFEWYRDKKYSKIEYVLPRVKKDGLELKKAFKGLRNNFRIVLAAVTQNGNALQFASESLKENKEIVLAAVRENGNALEYASYFMKDDELIAYEATKNNKYRVNLAFSYISDRLQKCDYLKEIRSGYTLNISDFVEVFGR